MRGKPWSQAEDELVLAEAERLQPHGVGDWIPIGVKVGRTGHACRLRVALLKQMGNIKVTEPNNSISDTFVSPLANSPLSEAQAIELFAIDLTRWEVVALSHNTWQVGQNGPDGLPVVTPLYQTTVKCKRIEGADSLTALATELLEGLKQPGPQGPVVLRIKDGYLGEVDPVDLHYGKLGWPAETEGDPYDLTIASRDFRDAFDDLLGKMRGFRLSAILSAMLNDLLQIDNLRSETTAGTRVDSDSRYHKIFTAATLDMRWAIERMKQVSPRVLIKGVPGNHDLLGGWSLMEVLRAVYENDPQVEIDNAPTRRKYFRWGNTLLGYTHGNEEKHSDLPLIMAQERPLDWAETQFRLWRLGHFHKKKSTYYTAGDSFHGVEVRVLRSLSGTDAWHYSRGYVKERRAIEAFVHHIEEGEVGAFISRLPQT